MDLTEIMDFLNEMNDASEVSAADEENMSAHFNSVGDLSPLQRSRANTWHGNRSIVKSEPLMSLEKENRTTPTESISGEHCVQSSNKHLGIDHSSNVICRKSISRRNAWGNFSYADMITKAINSSPEKRMTLSEIYNWMVQNIPFFKDKGDTNSSAGWKNSIRHNLSLHSCFMRVQNEGTGKSSWWMINPDYKASKLPRRRAVTMDNSKAMSLHQRKPKAAKKVDSLGSTDGLAGPVSKSRSTSSDLNFVEQKPEVSSSEDVFLPQEFRPRSSSNSGKTLRLSPALEADDPEQMSSWPVSETPDMEIQQEGYGKNQEYFNKMFHSSGARIQSPRSNINSPVVPIMKNEHGPNQTLPSSLPVPTNMSQAWNYNERDQATFQDVAFKNMRASEHMLMSGGGLVNAGHKNVMRNVPQQLWMSRSPSSTPLLRDYLSRDDYDAKNNSGQVSRSDVLYHQKLFSGGGHNVAPNSPNFSSPSINISPSWQQQQNHPSHGLLLQLLTDSSQQQQQPERRNSPQQQHAHTYSHSPTNQSMLQHLLTVRQKSHRQVLQGQHQYHQYIPNSHQHSPHQIHPAMEHQRINPSQMPQHFFDAMNPLAHYQPPRQPSNPSLPPPPLQFNPQHQHFQDALLVGDSKPGELLNDLLADSHFPSDLDFSLLELDSSADIECNIDQVIDHEKKFGELWDFNFDEDFLSENKNFHESIK